jgi:hypothetical protein
MGAEAGDERCALSSLLVRRSWHFGQLQSEPDRYFDFRSVLKRLPAAVPTWCSGV